MEGTRHERAAIVIASYIIGFVTAFMFVAHTTDLMADPFTSLPSSNPASVAAAVPVEVAETPVVTEAANEGELTYKDGQLVYTASDGEHLLSFNPETADLTVDTDELTQGYHYGTLNYTASKNNQFIFFCEQQTVSGEMCLPYVYDTNADRIFPITNDGEVLPISIDLASNALWTAVGLKIGSYYSVNTSAPWAMAMAEGALDLR